MKITPFARAQMSWAVFVLALFGMLELSGDQNLARFYLTVMLAFFVSRLKQVISNPYWVVDVILGIGFIYIFGKYIAGT